MFSGAKLKILTGKSFNDQFERRRCRRYELYCMISIHNKEKLEKDRYFHVQAVFGAKTTIGDAFGPF